MRMKPALVALVALASGAAAPAPQTPGEPEARAKEQGDAVPANCRDTIQQVRADRGLPLLDRGNARADEALLVAAVDQRVGGCSVLVMRNDTGDIRPLPQPSTDGKLQPVR